MADEDVVFRVKRYRPEAGSKPTYQEYRIPYRDDMVVLDGLNYIKDHVDPTLTYRWSCRMGICGSWGAERERPTQRPPGTGKPARPQGTLPAKSAREISR